MKQLAVAILSLNPATHFPLAKKMISFIGRSLFFILLIALFAAEILRVYYVMPFPGSQQTDTVAFAYWLRNNIVWTRLLAFSAIIFALVRAHKAGRKREKSAWAAALVAYTTIFILFTYRFEADRIFYQPSNKHFLPAVSSLDKNRLVIGVFINGEARAYPIQLIGYHHQVMDTIGSTPVMITYCTVCHTGRAFNPVVNGRQESFRLVGMDHFNAVFEDASTQSWWRQATGEAIAGPLKGTALQEFPSQQLPLESWLRQYPGSLIMEPDSLYDDRYFKLEDYDRGTMQSDLVKRNYLPWQPKSWVVGVKNELNSKVYDWNDLVQKRIIQDSVNALPILLTMENDTTSFHVFDRRVKGFTLNFDNTPSSNVFTDLNTKSTWNMDGICIDGELKGSQLNRVQAYNEFWHSWKTFHANAERFVADK